MRLNKYNMRNMMLMLAFLLAACSGSSQSPGANGEQVSALEFKEKLTPKDQLIDVRTPAEWAGGYIKGAKRINWFNSDFEHQVGALDKSKPVFVYCRSGNRSGKAMKLMQDLGFSMIYNLQGGVGAWSAAGFELVTE